MVGGIGIVAIGHKVEVGLYLTEHASNHIALTLRVFVTHDSTGGCGLFDGTVGGVVVVDINVGLGQQFAEIAHHLADGFLFIIARQQDRNLIVHNR